MCCYTSKIPKHQHLKAIQSTKLSAFQIEDLLRVHYEKHSQRWLKAKSSAFHPLGCRSKFTAMEFLLQFLRDFHATV
jgi:hypothetical protein